MRTGLLSPEVVAWNTLVSPTASVSLFGVIWTASGAFGGGISTTSGTGSEPQATKSQPADAIPYTLRRDVLIAFSSEGFH